MSPALIPFSLLLGLLLIWPISRSGRSATTGLAVLAFAFALSLTLSALPIVLAGDAIRARPGFALMAGAGLRLDGLSLVFLLAMLVSGGAAAFAAGRYFEEADAVRRFQATLLALSAALCVVILANVVWLAAVGWFLAAGLVFLLVWKSGDLPSGPGKALPGLVAALLSGGLIFTGLWQLAALAGSDEITLIFHRGKEITASGAQLVPGGLILLGVVIAAGLMPFRIGQTRALQAHATAVAFVLPAGLGLAAVYMLARLTPALSDMTGGAGAVSGPFWSGTLLALAALSFLGGGISALWRRGASGISEAVLSSQMALALMLAGQGDGASRVALAFVVMSMVPAATALFLLSGGIGRETGSQRLPLAGGLMRRMRLTAWMMALALASLAGTMPFAGYHVLTLILSGAQSLAGTGAAPLPSWLLPAVMVAGYGLLVAALLHMVALALRAAPERPDRRDHSMPRDPGWQLLLVPALLLALVVVIGLMPEPFLDLALAMGRVGLEQAPWSPVPGGASLWPGPTEAEPWLWLGAVGIGFLVDGLHGHAPRPKIAREH